MTSGPNGSVRRIPSSYDPPISRGSRKVLEDDWGLTHDLKQLLECPACNEIAIPPIFLCQRGHMICHLCRGNVIKCPMCDSDYTTMRNDLAESILGKCTFRCPFAEQGCFQTLKGSDVSQHFAECDYRPVICNIYTASGKPCDKVVSYSDHVHHMRNDHGVIGVDGASAVIGMSTTVKLGQGNWTFPAHYMNAFGQIFWCNLHASFNLLIAWVSMSGTKFDLGKYAAAVTLFDPNKKWQQAKWIGQVHSIRTTAKEVYDSGNCLALLPESFLLLSNVTVDDEGRKIKRWRCHFEIIEIEEKITIVESDVNNNQTDGFEEFNPNEVKGMKSYKIWATIGVEGKHAHSENEKFGEQVIEDGQTQMEISQSEDLEVVPLEPSETLEYHETLDPDELESESDSESSETETESDNSQPNKMEEHIPEPHISTE